MTNDTLLSSIRDTAEKLGALLDRLPSPRAIGGGSAIGSAVRRNEREGAKINLHKLVKMAEKAIRDEELYK